MGCAALLCGRFADVQELHFKPEKRSDMSCVKQQGGLFADCQEWCFLAGKRSDKSSTILQDGRFADAQESRFLTSKSSNMGSSSCYVVDLMMFRNSVFILQNVQIWAVPNCSLSGMAFSGCETFR